MTNQVTQEERGRILARAKELIAKHGEAVKLVADILSHEFSISRDRATRAAAKAIRQLRGEKRSRGGTPPNTSVVLTPTELDFIHHEYGGEKSRAIHDGLSMLMSKAP